jgi:hypothetical protein
LLDDAIRSLGERELTMEVFNVTDINKYFASMLEKHNIYFVQCNGVEFVSNDKAILYTIENGTLKHFRVRNAISGNTLIERIYENG